MLPHAQPSVEERVLHEFVAAVQCNVPHESAGSLSLIHISRRLAPEDTLLCSGAAALYDYWLSQMDLSLYILRHADEPIQLAQEPYRPGSYTSAGYRTPSGRYELRSGLMLQMGYSALPEYEPPRSDAEIREFPFVLSVGNRQTFGFHSRTHRIGWIRAMQDVYKRQVHCCFERGFPSCC